MKNYFIRAIITTVAYIIAYLLIDYILGDMHSFWSYAIQQYFVKNLTII